MLARRLEDRIAEERLVTFCRQLLRAKDLSVLEMVAEELHAAIQAHVNQTREKLGYVPTLIPEPGKTL